MSHIDQTLTVGVESGSNILFNNRPKTKSAIDIRVYGIDFHYFLILKWSRVIFRKMGVQGSPPGYRKEFEFWWVLVP